MIIHYGFAPGFQWENEVDQYLIEMTNDIGCVIFVRESNMGSATSANGIVFFDGNQDGDGQCWSALGMAPGFKVRFYCIVLYLVY